MILLLVDHFQVLHDAEHVLTWSAIDAKCRFHGKIDSEDEVVIEWL